MLNLFKKKEKNANTEIFSPVSGEFVKIEDVSDPTFSQKMLGDGFAVFPSESYITSPVKGKVSMIFPTKHAIGIITNHGEEVILHIGVGTVELNGEPFEVLIKEGSEVSSSTTLMNVNFDYLEEHRIDPTVIVVFTNLSDEKKLYLNEVENVQASNRLGMISN